MKKKYSLLLTVLSITILFSACGKIDANEKSSENANSSSALNNVTSETSSTDIDKANDEIEEETKTTEINISANSGYADSNHGINVIGLKSYKKLDDGINKDKAGKNKRYLVLFLEINNKMLDEDYINVNYLSTKVDGKKIKNTYLLNYPEGFETIFQHVEAQGVLRGFIVWKVPKDWKKIEIKYSGWKDSEHLNINCTFTPDDYFDPPQYS